MEGGGTVAVGFLLVGVLAAFLVVGGWWCVVDGRGRWSVVVVVVRDSPLVVLVSLRCLWLGVVGLDWPGSAMAWLDGRRRRCGLRGWGRQWRVGGGSDVECDRRCGSSQ